MELAELLPWIIVAAVVLVVVAVVLYVLRRRKQKERSDRLRDEFGPEYDRTVDRADSRSDAEDALEERQRRHERMRLRSLSAEERHGFLARWEDLQASFVDGPASAVRGADVLLDDVALARGYPDAPADQRLDDLAVDHSDEVHEYRQARGRADGVEDERRSLLASRGLFEALLGPGSDVDEATPDAPFDDHLTMGGREPTGTDAGHSGGRGDDRDADGRPLHEEGPRSDERVVPPSPPRSETN